MIQPKDTDWLHTKTSAIYIYAIYKRLSSDLGTHTE